MEIDDDGDSDDDVINVMSSRVHDVYYHSKFSVSLEAQGKDIRDKMSDSADSDLDDDYEYDYSEYTDDEIEKDGWKGKKKKSNQDEEYEYDYENEEEKDDEEEADEIEEEEIPMLSDIKVLFEGQGETYPEKGSLCRIHYTCKLQDGTLVESSRARNKPLEVKIGLGHVIRGWEECISKMVEGQHSIITVPPEAGYGNRGLPPKIPPNATLVYEIELIKITDPPPPTSFNLRIEEEVSSEEERYSDYSSEGEDGGFGWGEDGEDME